MKIKMHYRVYDEQNAMYLLDSYNTDSRQEVKESVKSALLEDLSEDDLNEIFNLKWDQYVVRLRTINFIVESQPTPFPSAEDSSIPKWEEDDWYEDGDETY